MLKRFWNAVTTWLMLADAFEASCLSARIPLWPRWELLREKWHPIHTRNVRSLAGGFMIRRNRADANVLISMPLEYGILEWNFSGRTIRVVDAGANIGCFALYLSCFAQIDRYIGIESAPENFRLLKANMERLGTQYTAVQTALSDKPGNLVFDLSGQPSQFRQCATGTTLSALPLDAVAEVTELPAIDLLKIDVEGAELNVLQGAARTLARTQHVMLEIHHEQIGQTGVAQLFSLLEREFRYLVYERSADKRQMNCFCWRREGPA